MDKMAIKRDSFMSPIFYWRATGLSGTIKEAAQSIGEYAPTRPARMASGDAAH
jgi:hypothetical protein